MTVPSVLVVIEIVDVALSFYFPIPASEPKLAKPDEVRKAISGLQLGKASVTNSIPKRAFKHLPQLVECLLAEIFNAVLLTHHFRTYWKPTRMISIS
jgi:hypothetical protein